LRGANATWQSNTKVSSNNKRILNQVQNDNSVQNGKKNVILSEAKDRKDLQKRKILHPQGVQNDKLSFKAKIDRFFAKMNGATM
jgi:hypothetical protein